MTDQSILRDAILDAGKPVPEGLTDGHNAPAGKRFSVYRNNVIVSLREALEAGFPVLHKLLGAQNFDQLAGLFVRAHPPTSPLMMQYGAALPGFLEQFEGLAHLGYLPDIARLELAMRESYHAADHCPLDPAALAAVPEDQLGTIRLSLAPSVCVLKSDWPVHDIWTFNMVDGAAAPRAIAQDVLVARAEFDPAPILLPPGGAACLNALADGRALDEAVAAGSAAHPDFDFGSLLGLLLTHNALCALKDERSPECAA